ncbi:uncharacterized protein LOC124428491 isoform X2 [Vespa crabro]|uniref:uncharacterized protein LOC124428491 isoform X2 n=1 Tax=Vespa crabro TaxID=7445 RepID=UPI001F016509|nr:uncharacterized protein LOC124428491 isoform X2 [Vespa crabro]
MRNSSLEYELPYKTRTMVKLDDITTYTLYSIYQWLIVITMISGYVGSDCLFASLALHITGQFAILRCKVVEAFEDTDGYNRGMKKLVIKHHRLIRLAETLEDGFNIMIFQQLLGTTLNLCVSGYYALSMGLGDTLYQSNWYDVSAVELKTMYICMERTKKPLKLTSAKFCALSLDTFSEILKTSIGYLSVLRAFL